MKTKTTLTAEQKAENRSNAAKKAAATRAANLAKAKGASNKPAVVSASQLREAKDAQTTVGQTDRKTAYKLEIPPRGKALFTYWLAVMSYLGGFTPERKPFHGADAKKFFYSGSVIANHTSNGNLEHTDKGFIRLTVTGWNYFNGRLTGSNVGQEVDKKEMEIMREALASGKVKEKTARFPVDTRFIKITL